METKTGYEISESDFARLWMDDSEHVAPLLLRWFGIDGPFDLASVHAAIQANPERQQSIYNVAMTLWR